MQSSGALRHRQGAGSEGLGALRCLDPEKEPRNLMTLEGFAESFQRRKGTCAQLLPDAKMQKLRGRERRKAM